MHLFEIIGTSSNEVSENGVIRHSDKHQRKHENNVEEIYCRRVVDRVGSGGVLTATIR
jgi:hypothetical protein